MRFSRWNAGIMNVGRIALVDRDRMLAENLALHHFGNPKWQFSGVRSSSTHFEPTKFGFLRRRHSGDVAASSKWSRLRIQFTEGTLFARASSVASVVQCRRCASNAK